MKNEYKIISDTVVIYLKDRKGNVYETLIDIDDFDKVNQFEGTWFAYYRINNNSFYARNSVYTRLGNGKCTYKCTFIHNLVMDFETNDEEFIDHIKHDTLDNRKKNLRKIKCAENSKNRKSRNSNNKSGYRNVCWDNRNGKWIVQLQIAGKCLGKFDENEINQAGKFAEEQRRIFYGEFAGFN